MDGDLTLAVEAGVTTFADALEVEIRETITGAAVLAGGGSGRGKGKKGVEGKGVKLREKFVMIISSALKISSTRFAA